MIVLKLCLLFCILSMKCNSVVMLTSPPPPPLQNARFSVSFNRLSDITPTSQLKCSNITSAKEPAKQFSLNIRLPFLDMELQHEHAVHILREPEQQLMFVIHGNELFQLFIDNKDKRLTLLGTLVDSNARASEALGAAIINWHNYLLIAIAYEDSVNIYQISKLNIVQRAAMVLDKGRAHNPALRFELIQRLSMPGKYRQLHLFKPAENRVMLLIAVNFTKLQGKYKTFEWLDAYFNPVDEVSLPAIQSLNVIGTDPKFVITGRAIRSRTQTVLTIYEVKSLNMKFLRRQTLTVDAHLIHAATFRRRNYIIACDTKRCMYFRMVDGQFVIYKKRSNKELAFDKFVTSNNLLVSARQQEVRIYNNDRLDCFSGFSLKENDLSALFTHTNSNNESYIILSYKRPFRTLIRMVELDLEGNDAMLSNAAPNILEQEDMTPLQRHRHQFEQTIGQLRSILLQRKTAMDTFRRVAYMTTPGIVRYTRPLKVSNSTIDIVQIISEHVRSPMQIKERVQTLREIYGRRRLTRSFAVGANSDGASKRILNVRGLHVKNIIYAGNLLKGYHMDNLTRPLPILTIKPKVTTKLLQTQKLLTRHNYKRLRHVNAANDSSPPELRSLDVRELHVQRINNMSWFEFYDALFLRDRDTKIDGRLILQSAVKVVNLWTTLINGLVVSQLFNLRLPQVVHSNIFMSRFFTSQIEAVEVNGLNFAHDIVFRGQDSYIETPVTIYELNVSGDIFFGNHTKWARMGRTDEETMGLQQLYTGKVIINGSLTVNNLIRESIDTTKFIINEQTFSTSLLKTEYLLQNTPQVFKEPIEFGNAKVSTPSLNTSYLNGHSIGDHLLDTIENNFKLPLHIIFMNASLDGDLNCQDYDSKLKILSQNVVYHGDVANITGKKQFMAPLKIDELMTLTLNEMPVNNLVLKSELDLNDIKFRNTKSFIEIIVNEKANISQELNATALNNLPLTELLNYDYHLERLEIPHRLKSQNVVFQRINGFIFDDVFTKLSVENEKLLLHKDLMIEGNVLFEHNLLVDNINGIDWRTYQKNLVRYDENAQLTGKKLFLADVVITDTLQANNLNGRNMQRIFDNILLRTTPQIISGEYTFEGLKLKNLDVLHINDLPISELIDTREPQVELMGDYVMPKMLVYGNVFGSLNSDADVDFENIGKKLQGLQNQQWRNLVVLGNVSWQQSNAPGHNAQMDYLLANAVTRSGNQTISGNVKLQQPIIHKMQTKLKFPKNIDFKLIAEDALLKNSTKEQIVHAPKKFLQSVNFEKLHADHIHATRLNGIDIRRFNDSLYRLKSDAPINGPLYFTTPPIIGNLVVSGLINGIKSDALYQQAGSYLPPVQLKRLVIDDSLVINDINGMNLNYLLDNRVPLDGEAMEIFGDLTFEQLNLTKLIMLRSINEIPFDNLVLTKSKRMQAITGPKHILGNLVLAGPAHVMKLNGRDLSENYQHSIFTNRDYNIDSLILEKATFEGGLMYGSNMVGSSKMMDDGNVNTTHTTTLMDLRNELHDLSNVAALTRKRTRQLIYLDYDLKTKIYWQKASLQSNQTSDQTIYYSIDDQHTQCERNRIRLDLISKRTERHFYLTNTSTNLLHAHVGELSVKAENFCKIQYRKVRSKLTISCRHLQKTIGMKKFIRTIEIMKTHTEPHYYVLMHAMDLVNSHNEIRILKVDFDKCNITDWQSITLGVGNVMRLFRLQSNFVLLTNGIVKHYPTVSVYIYDTEMQQFVHRQNIIGDFDIIEFIEMPSTKEQQILLSCRHCQRISIYTYREFSISELFEIQQILRLNTNIAQIIQFQMKGISESPLLLVLPEQGYSYYQFFRYAHLQGWVLHTYGFLQNLKFAIPLIDFNLAKNSTDNQPLVMLCDSNARKCSVIIAIL